MTRVMILLPAALTLLPPPDVAAEPSRDEAKSTIEAFNREPRSGRPDRQLFSVNYADYGGESFAYTLSSRFVRLVHDGEQFRVRKTKYKNDYVRLELMSTRGAEVKLEIYDNGQLSQTLLDDVLPAVLSDVFVFADSLLKSECVGNASSRLVHIRRCNHLPGTDQRRPFPSADAAIVAGFTPCGVCFADGMDLPIADYVTKRMQAVEDARIFEIAFPALDDTVTQNAITSLGESIVESLVIEPIGYKYRFRVLDSALPAAVSFSTGFVYVTDKLWLATETTMEQRFILAHEIAHVEVSDRYAVPEPNPMSPGGYYAALRAQETLADLLAIVSLADGEGAPAALTSAAAAMRKLQFAYMIGPKETTGGTHPTFQERLQFFDDEQFQIPVATQVFCGMDEDGNTLARLHVLGTLCWEEQAQKQSALVYLMIEATDSVNGKLGIPYSDAGTLVDASQDRFTIVIHDGYFPEIGPNQVGLIVVRVTGREGDSTSPWRSSGSHRMDCSEMDGSRIEAVNLNVAEVAVWGACGASTDER